MIKETGNFFLANVGDIKSTVAALSVWHHPDPPHWL
jgi:hypothetical protein